MFKRLLYAFEAIGVLMASLQLMLLRVRRVAVLFGPVFAAAAVCFHLFGGVDGWGAPFYRLIGAEEAESYKSHPVLIGLTFIYTVTVDITILNLMIAIMTDTYFKARAADSTQHTPALATPSHTTSDPLTHRWG